MVAYFTFLRSFLIQELPLKYVINQFFDQIIPVQFSLKLKFSDSFYRLNRNINFWNLIKII